MIVNLAALMDMTVVQSNFYHNQFFMLQSLGKHQTCPATASQPKKSKSFGGVKDTERFAQLENIFFTKRSFLNAEFLLLLQDRSYFFGSGSDLPGHYRAGSDFLGGFASGSGFFFILQVFLSWKCYISLLYFSLKMTDPL